ncbi:DUF262 and DUF1524 [Desulfonema limicola]|uniref:DUF262 and DUF1524 n=1 Tax=Desulfonema limicola TaxID=45656 RepID=A0A975BCB9_9BACT|nr:DUF262 domain-containing protein [Desulfonema limicola]QTA82713.1 DUF262 and DUF1524 [Desulfonema limicola]
MNINSSLITLKDIVEKDYFFNVPIYQRLYVWEEDQIKTLLEDIETAYDNNKELFYIGGVLVVENKSLEQGKFFDLIDGQQRFTTLWMIAIIFTGKLSPFIKRVEKDKNRHRITFDIREDVYKFFKDYINSNNSKPQYATPRILNALSLIEKYKSQFEMEQKGKSSEIATYIYEKVKLIFTDVPKQTDLNKMFEIINNRGVQLQHHEILKAQLLEKIASDERLKYSYLWDACSYMDNYVEKNIRDIAEIKIQDLFDNESSKNGIEKLGNPLNLLESINKIQNEDFSPMNLLEILNSSDIFESKDNNKTEDYEADEIRSIITFPMLLQHTLRIFLVQKQEKDIPKILENELLNIFSDHFLKLTRTQDEIKEFIELLWQVRYLFDKHIIKWVRLEDSETHLICKLEKYESGNNYYLRRIKPNSNKGEALLQSMLYHSQQITTHYWLSPYLKHLIDNNGQGSYDYLKQLDNYLFCSNEKETLAVRTRSFLEYPNRKTALNTKILEDPLGTAFPHYWFYKLEFVLWEKYAKGKNEKWKNFKMTAKNSVEHISPQTQKDVDKNIVSDIMLNRFGNLALVSRSINSEYSNLPFNEKRQRFINNNQYKLDSLKMDFIYSNEEWDDLLAKEHQDEMIKALNEYLGI